MDSQQELEQALLEIVAGTEPDKKKRRAAYRSLQLRNAHLAQIELRKMHKHQRCTLACWLGKCPLRGGVR